MASLTMPQHSLIFSFAMSNHLASDLVIFNIKCMYASCFSPEVLFDLFLYLASFFDIKTYISKYNLVFMFFFKSLSLFRSL